MPYVNCIFRLRLEIEEINTLYIIGEGPDTIMAARPPKMLPEQQVSGKQVIVRLK